METANKLIYKQTNYFKEDGEKYRIIVIVSLDDDCHNNMCDWSITADIRQKNKVIIYQFTPLPTNNHKLYKYYLC